VRVIVSPARVQGDGAAEEIVRALDDLNRLGGVEVIVVGRGGGSVEDLWAFNEETVARAIAASAIPVVSAVGHEIDFTIADFVADLRAPTPSAAAELIVPDRTVLRHHLAQLAERARRRLLTELARRRSHLEMLKRTALFREPAARLAQARQRLDLAHEALRAAAQAAVRARRERIAASASALRHYRPDQVIALRRERLQKAAAMLRLLSPEATLARGYSLTMLESGAMLRSVGQAAPGARLHTTVRDGKIASTVANVLPQQEAAQTSTPRRRSGG
jgi:exodeoxyribonuclease VII large subunit